MALIKNFTEIPTPRNAYIGSLLSIFFAVILFAFYWILRDSGSFLFFALAAILLACHALICLMSFKGNLIITFRYLLLFIPIFVTTLTWFVWEGSIFIAPFGMAFQTIDSTSAVVLVGALSIFGCACGWFTGFRKKDDFDTSCLSVLIKRKVRLISYAGLFLALFFGGLYLFATGGIIGSGKLYADGSGPGIGFVFSVFNIFHLTGIALIIASMEYKRKWRGGLFTLGMVSLVFGMMAGSRADYMLPAMLLFFYFINSRRVDYKNSFKERVHGSGLIAFFKRYLTLGVIIIIGFILSSAIAIWRHNPDLEFIKAILEIISKGSGLIFKDFRGVTLIWMETANHMIGGLYGMIVKIDVGEMNFLLGDSYFDWLLKLPPAFLGLPRPEGLEWQTAIYGQVMSQGGIFEPAEAYANFGFIGCFVVSFMISFFFSWLLRAAHKRNSLFFLAWYMVNGLMLLRAVWYQNFAFMRIASIFFIFWCLLQVVDRKYIRFRLQTYKTT